MESCVLVHTYLAFDVYLLRRFHLYARAFSFTLLCLFDVCEKSLSTFSGMSSHAVVVF